MTTKLLPVLVATTQLARHVLDGDIRSEAGNWTDVWVASVATLKVKGIEGEGLAIGTRI